MKTADKVRDPYVREELAVASVIERRLGRFRRLPELVFIDRLHDQMGAWGVTSIKEGVIALDTRLLANKKAFLNVFTHELLEWRLREKGVKYSHREAERLTPQVLKEAGLAGPGDPPGELEAFLWGMLAGGILTIAVGGVLLLYTWPILVRVLSPEVVAALEKLRAGGGGAG